MKKNNLTKDFLLTKKGFLFTISIIMFASTLVFFAQLYSASAASNEASVITSARPLNVSSLNDDISFDLGKIFGVSFDANQDSGTVLFISGAVPSSTSVAASLSSYSSGLLPKLFPLSSGTKSVDFSDMNNGLAKVFFNNSFEYDYYYSSNSVELFPLVANTVSRIDLNLRVTGDLNHSGWVSGPVAGATTLNLIYSDDSNTFSLTAAIDPSSLSELVLYYSDSNTSLFFGNSSGSKTSALKIANYSGKRTAYSIRVAYLDANIFPVFWNAFLRVSDAGLDSNSRLVIIK